MLLQQLSYAPDRRPFPYGWLAVVTGQRAVPPSLCQHRQVVGRLGRRCGLGRRHSRLGWLWCRCGSLDRLSCLGGLRHSGGG
eukprot:360823-Chlamydomonas_euryale.AAC.1